jgi:hypothetical protein
MSRSSAAASSITQADGSGHDHTDDSGDGLSKLGQPDVSPKKFKKDIPPSARLWGFIRQLNVGETLDVEASNSVKQAERDVAVWWNVDGGRFLIAAEKKVVDDVSPLQFVQFVRQLRDVTSRILFKYERRSDGTTGCIYRVWS